MSLSKCCFLLCNDYRRDDSSSEIQVAPPLACVLPDRRRPPRPAHTSIGTEHRAAQRQTSDEKKRCNYFQHRQDTIFNGELSSMASFARSCRAAWATNSAVASSSTAQSSSTGPSSLRLLTTSAPALAAKAAKPRQPAKKQKAANKKASSSGPRSVGPRKRSGGDSSNAASATLSTPFYKQSANMSHVPTLVPEEVAANLNRAMAFSDTALDAFQKFGVEKKLKRSVS